MDATRPPCPIVKQASMERLALLQSLSSDQNGSLYKTYLEDKLAASQQLTSSGSAGAHPGAPRSLGASPRPPSGNLSDGGIYGCGEDFHRLSCATGCTVGSCEWRAGSSDGDSVAAADADGGGNATMPPEETASVACWADLPDGILREVTRHMSPSYLRVMRLVCRSWAEFAGRHTSTLKPERLEGPRLSLRFPHLRSLDLSHCQRMIVHPKQNELRLQSSLTDGGLAFLAPLKHLRTLSLKNCVMLEGSGLRHITGLSLLRTLDLTGCARLTNKGLEHVAALAALTHLNLRECRLITNDGLRRLEPLTQLKTFSMSNCTSVSDRGLQSLAKLTGLEHINISRCNYVTDRGFSTLLLSPLPHLKRIVVRKCPGVTEDGLREIAAAKAANDGCRLELPSPRPEPRRTTPAVPFMDAWLHQGFQPAAQAHPAGNIHAGAGHLAVNMAPH